jgi:hypothetical protein
MRFWHLQNQVGIIRDCHKLGKGRSSKESVLRHLKVSHLKLQVFSTEIFLSRKGHGKGNLTDGGSCCTMDYVVERSPTGARCRSGQPHLVKGLQEQDVQGATSIDTNSVELDSIDNGANNERIPPRLWHKVRVVTAVKGDGDLIPH